MSNPISPSDLRAQVMLLLAEDAPEVFELKSKGKRRKVPHSKPKVLSQKPERSFKKRPGYRLYQRDGSKKDDPEGDKNSK